MDENKIDKHNNQEVKIDEENDNEELHPDLQYCGHPGHLQQRLYSSSALTLDDIIDRIHGSRTPVHYFIKSSAASFNLNASNDNNNGETKTLQNMNEVIQVILDPYSQSKGAQSMVILNKQWKLGLEIRDLKGRQDGRSLEDRRTKWWM